MGGGWGGYFLYLIIYRLYPRSHPPTHPTHATHSTHATHHLTYHTNGITHIPLTASTYLNLHNLQYTCAHTYHIYRCTWMIDDIQKRDIHMFIILHISIYIFYMFIIQLVSLSMLFLFYERCTVTTALLATKESGSLRMVMYM